MKNYTVVYAKNTLIGSHMNSITRFKHITTDDIENFLEKDFEIEGASSVWFIFEGHRTPLENWESR